MNVQNPLNDRSSTRKLSLRALVEPLMLTLLVAMPATSLLHSDSHDKKPAERRVSR